MKMASTPDERRAAADPVSAFLDRIATRQARVGVVGLGYVGLPPRPSVRRRGGSKSSASTWTPARSRH